ncbi:MAG: metallophosphoesterase family protein, partial [Candidatus Hodarchaeales archaeon]
MYSFAVISDIHGNIIALDTVLEHLNENYAVSRLACLGDIVGYGPRPLECIE